MSLVGGKAWSFEQGQTRYFLRGNIVIPPNDRQDIWSGTLTLPRVEIPID
ncbi:MAG: hypothetical protein WD042_16115 [Phycisphaeraceae bacterium]